MANASGTAAAVVAEDAGPVTEQEARAALRAFVGIGDVEPWITRQPWQAVPGGWTAVWTVPGR